MNEQKRQQRRQQLRKFDAWLERLFREHRFLFYLLSMGISVVIFGIAALLEEFLKWVVR
jgi:hypothetical protein